MQIVNMCSKDNVAYFVDETARMF